jgi:hypothetical protein
MDNFIEKLIGDLTKATKSNTVVWKNMKTNAFEFCISPTDDVHDDIKVAVGCDVNYETNKQSLYFAILKPNNNTSFNDEIIIRMAGLPESSDVYKRMMVLFDAVYVQHMDTHVRGFDKKRIISSINNHKTRKN